VLLFSAGDCVVVLHDAHRLPQRTQILPALLFEIGQDAQLLADLHSNFLIFTGIFNLKRRHLQKVVAHALHVFEGWPRCEIAGPVAVLVVGVGEKVILFRGPR